MSATGTPFAPLVLVEADEETWSVRRRDGSVTPVRLASVTAGRIVPPGRAATASLDQVERIAALGWRALDTNRLGDWLHDRLRV